MAKLIDMHPAWRTASPDQVIAEMSMENLIFLLEKTTAHYEQTLPLWRVMNHYEIANVDGTQDAYVPCRLLSHGGTDKIASASYYINDRNTGEAKESFYCFKCQKSLTSFWYTYAMEKDWHELSLRDIYTFIYRTFRVSPPLELWFEFDPLNLSFDDTRDDTVDVSKHFEDSLALRAIKYVDTPLYLARLKSLLSSAQQK